MSDSFVHSSKCVFYALPSPYSKIHTVDYVYYRQGVATLNPGNLFKSSVILLINEYA